MTFDELILVEIDPAGRLCLYPQSVRFPGIWQHELSVYWEDDPGFLYSAKPPRWGYARCYEQIQEAVRVHCGVQLEVGRTTRWKNVDPALQLSIYGWKPSAGSYAN